MRERGMVWVCLSLRDDKPSPSGWRGSGNELDCHGEERSDVAIHDYPAPLIRGLQQSARLRISFAMTYQGEFISRRDAKTCWLAWVKHGFRASQD